MTKHCKTCRCARAPQGIDPSLLPKRCQWRSVKHVCHGKRGHAGEHLKTPRCRRARYGTLRCTLGDRHKGRHMNYTRGVTYYWSPEECSS